MMCKVLVYKLSVCGDTLVNAQDLNRNAHRMYLRWLGDRMKMYKDIFDSSLKSPPPPQDGLRGLLPESG